MLSNLCNRLNLTIVDNCCLHSEDVLSNLGLTVLNELDMLVQFIKQHGIDIVLTVGRGGWQ